MNGFIQTVTVQLGCVLVLMGLQGCAAPGGCAGGCGSGTCASGTCGHGGCGDGNGHSSCDLYDRCYPQRYMHMAAKEVNAALTPQVQNGHVLDQTVWNWDFEPGSEHLTAGGLQHLEYLTRRRPQADCVVYLQTAIDLPYDAACPERLAGARQELDTKRVQAVQKFLVAHSAGRPVDFQILIHDPNDPTISTIGASNSVQQMFLRYRGGLATQGGGAGGGGGGGGGGGTGR